MAVDVESAAPLLEFAEDPADVERSAEPAAVRAAKRRSGRSRSRRTEERGHTSAGAVQLRPAT
jgi:hypothetical protein